MKTSTTSLLLPALLGLGLAAMPLPPAAGAEPAPASAAKEDAPARGPVDVRGDGGVEAVQQAQADPGGDHYKPGVKAAALIDRWLSEDGYKKGWDEAKKRYIAVGLGEFNMQDGPTADPIAFCLNREVALQRALLDARAQIVEYANTKMDVVLQAETPGTDLNAKFGEERDKALARLRAQQETVASLMDEVSKSEADALRGVTSRDRANAMMDAAIKKLDATYSTKAIEEEKKTKLERARTRYQENLQKLQEIEAEIRKAKDSVTRSFSSKVSSLAKMPLFGSTCIFQTESWDSGTETYQVAVAMVWSVGLEKATRGIIQGQEVVLDAPKKGTTLQQWLDGQDLGAFIGPRTYMDEKGNRHFLGASARPMVQQASRMEKNRDIARLQSKAMTVLSLRADVEVSKTAEQMAQTLTTADGKEQEQAMESLSKKVRAKIEGQNINGLGQVFEKEDVAHTLAGIKMFVTISGIDPSGVKAARTMEEVNYAAAIAANKENARLQGRKDQLEASKEASRNDPASYQKGRNDAAGALQKQEADRQAQLKAREDASKKAEATKAKPAGQNKTLDGAAGNKPRKQAEEDEF